MIIAYLEKHDPERNMHRFYRMSICRTLFGQFALIREWGRCSNNVNVVAKSKKSKEIWFSSRGMAVSALILQEKKKKNRGYKLKYRNPIRYIALL